MYSVNYLPKARHQKVIHKTNGNNRDVQKVIISAIPLGYEQVRGPFAEQFRRDTHLHTAKAVYDFMRQNFIYNRDIDSHQIIALPSLAVDRKFNDCKSYTVFAASILTALGCPVTIKFAGNRGPGNYSHVYLLTGDHNEIILDGCNPRFNHEKNYLYQKLYRMNISAINDDLGVYAKPKKELTPEQKAKRAKAKARAKDAFIKFGRANMMLALVLGRAAFLACVAMNLNGLASKLQKLKDKGDVKDLETKWMNLGGMRKVFWKAVAYGAKKKKLFLSKKAKERYIKKFGSINGPEQVICAEEMSGVYGPELAAIAAAAIPVIAALVPVIIKAFKKMPGKDAEAEAADTAAQGSDLVQASAKAGGPVMVEQADAVETAVNGIYGPNDGTSTAGKYDALYGALGQLASTGIQAAADAISKKSPKAKKAVEKISQAGDDYVTGVYLRQSGIKETWTKAKEATGALGGVLPYALGAGVLVFLLARKK